jgi:hypothetical protein
VVVPDLRGIGRSSKPETGYDKKTQAKDIRAVEGLPMVNAGHRRVISDGAPPKHQGLFLAQPEQPDQRPCYGRDGASEKTVMTGRTYAAYGSATRQDDTLARRVQTLDDFHASYFLV